MRNLWRVLSALFSMKVLHVTGPNEDEMAPAAKKPKYLDEPKAEEVLDEQYAWLRFHTETCRKDGCEHCWRMNRLKEILMMPFRDERHYPIQIAFRKAKGAGK